MSQGSFAAEVLSIAACGAADLVAEGGSLDNHQVLARTPELARRFDAAEVEERFGVRRRGWVRGLGVDEADLAREAARRALELAQVPVAEIDLVVAATSTPSRATRSLAARVSAALDIRCAALDVRAGGAAGLVAWHTACRLLDAPGQTALVVVSEAISPWLDLEGGDLATLLFGDGAAALVLRAETDAGGLLAFRAGRDAEFGRSFTVPGPLPPVPGGNYTLRAADAEYASALDACRVRCAEILRDGDKVEAFFPCAPTRGSLERQERTLGVDAPQTHKSLGERGALGAATPLFNLAEADLTPGTTAAFSAVGGGVHWATMTWHFRRSPA